MLPQPTGPGRTTWPPAVSRTRFKANLVHAMEAWYPKPMPDDVRMTLISVYYNTRDHPGRYVAREWHLLRSGGLAKGEIVAEACTLNEAREPALQRGLYLIPRDRSDDRSLVESWI